MMNQAAQAIGTIASGAGSVISTGISYLGFKGKEVSPNMPGKMQGFGSDSYQGYMGSGGSTAYDPPMGGNQYRGIGAGSESTISPGGGYGGSAPKWGPTGKTPVSEQKKDEKK
jgi:hypothetical protein